MQEQEVGDGSNFVVCFTGELLHRAEELLRMGTCVCVSVCVYKFACTFLYTHSCESVTPVILEFTHTHTPSHTHSLTHTHTHTPSHTHTLSLIHTYTGLHPSEIIQGYQEASDFALKQLEELACTTFTEADMTDEKSVCVV
jgi:chaperonin GroEL (HSP60 family)